jgi:putative SOS response-associated peptidase YedK
METRPAAHAQLIDMPACGAQPPRMCNVYKLNLSQKVFDFESLQGANVAAEVYPNYPGVVIESGQARAMNWGFPRHTVNKRTGKANKPTPVNNVRDDRLRTYWRKDFTDRRCLIPVSQWAEAQGPKGRMTKTWYGLPGLEAFAVAGVWRPTDEWGDSYSMVMTDSSKYMVDAHDRMPVILDPADYDQWTYGTPDEAFALVRAWPDPLAVDATDELWYQPRKPNTQSSNVRPLI